MPPNLFIPIVAGAFAAVAVAVVSIARDEDKWPIGGMIVAFVTVAVVAFFLLGGRL
jgi:peptidoglycan/LPS O-acetylase OafA/YrhL